MTASGIGRGGEDKKVEAGSMDYGTEIGNL